MKILKGYTKEELEEKKKKEQKEIKAEQMKQIEKEKITFINNKVPPEFISKVFYQLDSGYLCPQCRKDIGQNSVNFFGTESLKDLYCMMNDIPCENCANSNFQMDQNKAIIEVEKSISNNAFGSLYVIVGAKTYFASFDMIPNQINRLFFTDLGIPETASIIEISYTPSGKYFPLEMHGNNSRIKQQYSDNSVRLWPADLYYMKDLKDSNVSVVITFFENNDDIVINNLLDAIDAFTMSNKKNFVMSLNRVFELLIGQVCFKEFHKRKGKNDVNNFLKSSATYGHQLNHLISLISKSNNAIEIDNEIISKMNTLRKFRNDIAHTGNWDNIEDKLSYNEMKKYLANCIVGASVIYKLLESV